MGRSVIRLVTALASWPYGIYHLQLLLQHQISDSDRLIGAAYISVGVRIPPSLTENVVLRMHDSRYPAKRPL